MKQIIAEPLTKEAFAPFGQVIGTHERTPDMSNEGFDYFHNEMDISNFEVKTTFGWLDMKPKALELTSLQSLKYSDEGYFPTDGKKSVIPVAPHNPETGLPDYDNLRLFILDKGMGVLVDKHIWHLAPYPLEGVGSFILMVRNDCFLEGGEELLVDEGGNVTVVANEAIALVV